MMGQILGQISALMPVIEAEPPSAAVKAVTCWSMACGSGRCSWMAEDSEMNGQGKVKTAANAIFACTLDFILRYLDRCNRSSSGLWLGE
jgi:hypothetical protein